MSDQRRARRSCGYQRDHLDSGCGSGRGVARGSLETIRVVLVDVTESTGLGQRLDPIVTAAPPADRSTFQIGGPRLRFAAFPGSASSGLGRAVQLVVFVPS